MARTRGVGLFRLLYAPICMSCRKEQVAVLLGGVEHEGLFFYIFCPYFYILLPYICGLIVTRYQIYTGTVGIKKSLSAPMPDRPQL